MRAPSQQSLWEQTEVDIQSMHCEELLVQLGNFNSDKYFNLWQVLAEMTLQGASRAHCCACKVIFKVNVNDGVICVVEFIGGADNDSVSAAFIIPIVYGLPLHGIFHEG